MGNPYSGWGYSETTRHVGVGGEGDTITTSGYNVPTPLANAYHPNQSNIELVGVRGGILLHQEAIYNGAGNPLTPGTAFTQTTFDTSTRADAAHILLTNGSTDDMVILAAAIRGARVYRLSGDNGYLHDKYIDYESIAMDGEKLYEIGNNMICTLAQVNQIADIVWKRNKVKRHIYTISQVGFNTFFEPGEWYTLQVGSAGQPEYINSVVMVYAIRTSLDATGIGYTQIDFMEVLQNWVFDSNETARFMAGGGFQRKPSGRIVTVASSTYIGSADYYCDGTADEVEINLALTAIAVIGGGTVQLTEGTFNVAAAINASYSNVNLVGSGNGTIISGYNAAWDTINSSGTAGTPIKNVSISNLLLLQGNIFAYYCNNISIQNCTLRQPAASLNMPIGTFHCDDVRIINNVIDGELVVIAATQAAISCSTGNRGIVSNNTVKNLRNSVQLYGIFVGNMTAGCIVSNNSIYNLSNSAAAICYGIWVGGSNYLTLSTNRIESVKNSNTAANSYGIYIAGGADVSTYVNCSNNYCYNNGLDLGTDNQNQNNFKDLGTNTQNS